MVYPPIMAESKEAQAIRDLTAGATLGEVVYSPLANRGHVISRHRVDVLFPDGREVRIYSNWMNYGRRITKRLKVKRTYKAGKDMAADLESKVRAAFASAVADPANAQKDRKALKRARERHLKKVRKLETEKRYRYMASLRDAMLVLCLTREELLEVWADVLAQTVLES